MFNPVRAYRKYVQRLELKRKVFDSEKNTLNLQALNLFVNGEPEKPRTAPTYLRAKTRDLLRNTIVQGITDDRYGEGLRGVAIQLVNWCSSPRAADNPNVRHWLKQLAEATPVERPAVESVEVESVKIPTWTVTQLIKDFGDGAGSHVSSEDVAQFRVSPKDVAPSHGTSEEDFDWSAAFDEATNVIEVESGTKYLGGSTGKGASIDSSLSAEDGSALTMSVNGLDSEDQPELHTAGSDEALRQWVDTLDVSKDENDPHDLFSQVDAKIAGRSPQLAAREAAARRRPAASLRPSQAPTRANQGVVREVNGQIVPAKQ
ncbi:MAG: hypothetical protein GTN84_08095 [Hydrogenophaga sp.]|uniref:hypothetical protein n=1 Tax=Hydrogenophaga sp. TaxID=1904254 RepID=UPI0016A9D29A|nr:hypothetical protein [Hydrogenophaga sp.]NIM41015.1 hypothetical protein [Hydrogenophaga sp.]NIN26373.1 hypothetical protein [Hydrogenophaga sp.]NIN31248.1 hypothetical protein [Hydrogenophaga sp.]NIN55287.1 hypothetical protein [Hydrogenophaga sp.]NIO53671.1 hypothetical protein [Hydrogenophaga sp.]